MIARGVNRRMLWLIKKALLRLVVYGRYYRRIIEAVYTCRRVTFSICMAITYEFVGQYNKSLHALLIDTVWWNAVNFVPDFYISIIMSVTSACRPRPILRSASLALTHYDYYSLTKTNREIDGLSASTFLLLRNCRGNSETSHTAWIADTAPDSNPRNNHQQTLILTRKQGVSGGVSARRSYCPGRFIRTPYRSLRL